MLRLLSFISTKEKHKILSKYTLDELNKILELKELGEDISYLVTSYNPYLLELLDLGLDLSPFNLSKLSSYNIRYVKIILTCNLDSTLLRINPDGIPNCVYNLLLRKLCAGENYIYDWDYTQVDAKLAINYMEWMSCKEYPQEFIKRVLMFIPIEHKLAVVKLMELNIHTELIRRYGYLGMKLVHFIEKCCNYHINYVTYLKYLKNIREEDINLFIYLILHKYNVSTVTYFRCTHMHNLYFSYIETYFLELYDTNLPRVAQYPTFDMNTLKLYTVLEACVKGNLDFRVYLTNDVFMNYDTDLELNRLVLSLLLNGQDILPYFYLGYKLNILKEILYSIYNIIENPIKITELGLVWSELKDSILS